MIGVPAASWVGQRRSPPTSAFWLVGYLLGGDRTYTPKCKRPNPSTEKYPKSVAEPHRHFLDCYQPKVQGEMKEPHEDAPFSYFSLRRRVRVGRSPDLQRALPQKPFGVGSKVGFLAPVTQTSATMAPNSSFSAGFRV